MASLDLAAAKEGVFAEWLSERPHADVVVLEEDHQEDEPQVKVPRLSERNGEAAAASAAKQQPVTPEDLVLHENIERREARLKPVTTWTQHVDMLGPYKVLTSAGRIRLKELNARVCYMEDSTELSPVERFAKYAEDGFILVHNLFGDDEGQKLLQDLRKAMCTGLKHQLGADVDPDTMEMPGTGARKHLIDIDHTVKIFPADGSPLSKGWKPVRDVGQNLLDSRHIKDLVDSFVKGANEYHGTTHLKSTMKYQWARVRGRQPPRKDWCEYFFMKMSEEDQEMRLKWDRYFAREFTRRRESAKPRYGFSVWVAVGPNPIDGGNLAFLPGSHLLTGFCNQNSIKEDIPLNFRKQVKGFPWMVKDLNPGDVFIVDMQVTRAYVANRRKPPYMFGAFADAMYLMTE